MSQQCSAFTIRGPRCQRWAWGEFCSTHGGVPDYSRDLTRAVNKLMPVVHAMHDGRWAPDAEEKALIASLAQAFDAISRGGSGEAA